MQITPQSAQSVPLLHSLDADPARPSSQKPSLLHSGLPMHSLVHKQPGGAGDGALTIDGGGGAFRGGGDGKDGGNGVACGGNDGANGDACGGETEVGGLGGTAGQ